MYLMFLAIAIGLVPTVTSHGVVTSILADGVNYTGYAPYFQYLGSWAPKAVGWSIPDDTSYGFVSPSNYSDPSIICHIGATPAPISATVTAGSNITFQWTTWPNGHKGPVLDYLAPCNGPCSSVDKTTLEFFKIDAEGLFDESEQDGYWAADQLIAQNSTWTIKIPEWVKPGEYVLRHEIIALHFAFQVNGTQNYPQCFNLVVKGSGTEQPQGEVATDFYNENDPGLLINIYRSLSMYVIPGPTVCTSSSIPTSTSIASTTSSSIVFSSGAESISSFTISSSTLQTSVISSPTSSPSATPSSTPYTTPEISPSIITASQSSDSTPPPSKTAPFTTAVPPPPTLSLKPLTPSRSVSTDAAATLPSSSPSSSSSISTSTSTSTIPPSSNSSATPVPTTSDNSTLSSPTSSTSTSAPSPALSIVASTMPTGTTLKTLFSWLTDLVGTIVDTGDTGLIGRRRRHARALSAR